MGGLLLNMNPNVRFQFFLSKHYEFPQQLSFLFIVFTMLLLLYLTFHGMDS